MRTWSYPARWRATAVWAASARPPWAVGDDLACGVKPGLAEAIAEAAGVQVAPSVVDEVVPGQQDCCGDVTAACRADDRDAVVFGG